jgi:hypothetical protein
VAPIPLSRHPQPKEEHLRMWKRLAAILDPAAVVIAVELILKIWKVLVSDDDR